MKKKELYAAPETEVLILALEQAILDASQTGSNENFGEDAGEGW